MSKKILVTGASSGIGAAIFAYLSEQGYEIYGTKLPHESSPQNLFDLDLTDANSIAHFYEVFAKESRSAERINQ